jgi:hypothetical protein
MSFADWLRARRERREEHRRALEEERLLKLYWNRVELKRSLDDLEEEVRQLRDLLKQQQALLLRAGEDAEGLEQVLANPELGFGAMVHFALRGLWRAGRVQLQQVATEMRRQLEEQERRAQQGGLQAARRLRLQEADGKIAAAQEQVTAARAQVAAAERDLISLSSPWHYFQRQEQRELLADVRIREQGAVAALESLRVVRATLLKEPLMEYSGLSVEGRRSVNLHVLALAQVLMARLMPEGIAPQMKLAWQRDLGSLRYGTRTECLARLAQVNGAANLLRTTAVAAPQMREQAERLAQAAVYRNGMETLPASVTLEADTAQLPGSNVTAAQLLADDYFEIRRILLS